MTEAEWLACDNPIAMLRALRHGASARKLRLFGCACCRRVWGELPSDLNRQLVAAVEDYPDELSRERYPDGPFSHPVLDDAIRASSSVESEHAESDAYWAVKYLGRTYYKPTAYQGAPVTALKAAASAKAARPGRPEKAAQADLLRCIFGPPHRPVAADPCWITPLVTSLATAAYEQRSLPSGHLDPARLAVLADALEDAGCTDPDLLGHLRAGAARPGVLGAGPDLGQGVRAGCRFPFAGGGGTIGPSPEGRAMRRLTLALCCLTAAAALAAPVPKPKNDAEWGRPINPGKKSKFTFAKGAVTIEVPAGYHSLGPGCSLERGNAPGLLRAAKGDFRAQVRVRGEFRPVPQPKRRGDAYGSTNAHMVVYGGDGKGKAERAFEVRLQSIILTHRKGTRRIRAAEVCMAGEGDREAGVAYSLESLYRRDEGQGAGVKWDGVWEAYFRVERRKGELSGYVSLDGKKWHGLERPHRWRDGTTGLRMEGDVKVGVAASSNSGGKFKVTFDQFKLTPLKAKD